MRSRIVLWSLLVSLAVHVPVEGAGTGFDAARRSARLAGYCLSKVQRWLHEVALPRIDPATGLYIADGHWNYRDTAADCYPFLTWAAYVVDEEALNGPVRAVLHAEMKLCNRVDRIPVPYDLKKKKPMDVSYEDMVFQASEYVKDGLIAIVEVTGKDEWFDRMKAIEEDLWKHARVDTPFGKIPTKNIEVNGEQLQALARLRTMTGEEKFLVWAERLADYYLSSGHFVPTRLRDHGCEIIGGLGLLLGVESEVAPERARKHAPAIKYMLDEIQARGLNPDGVMLNTIGDKPGRREGRLSDGWGYDYVGNLCYDMATGESRYRGQIETVLRNLAKPLYKNYPWEGKSIDGYADSIEGAIYLLNRVPVAEGFAWVDREVAANVAYSAAPLDTAPLWGTMKLQANGVRTVILYALMHTRGLIARPWRRDLLLGASENGEELSVVLKAEKDWSGRIVFDVPRHKLIMGFRRDWPRMNTMPEWFTVDLDQTYTVHVAGGKGSPVVKRISGRDLHRGLQVECSAGSELRLLVKP